MTESCFELPKIAGKYRFNVDLSKTNWFRVGGRAKIVFFPKHVEDLQFFLQNKPDDLRIIILGVGSNIIINDKDIDACIIKLNGEFAKIELKENNILEVGAGVISRNLTLFCQNNSLANLEFLTGIPGGVGGMVRMNAGCYGSEISNFLTKIIAIDFNGHIFEFKNSDCNFSYRHNDLSENLIFIKAFFKVKKSNKLEITKKINQFNYQRELNQPIKSKTGGSTFKNPKNLKAWELIDKSGCRGKKIGDAQISSKHCNFMINNGNCSASDLINLGEQIIDDVLEKTKIKLEWEIKIIK